MSSMKAAELSVADKRWLTKAEAMGYTNYLSEQTFDEAFGIRVTRYGSGRKVLYDKQELDRFIKRNLVIAGAVDLIEERPTCILGHRGRPDKRQKGI